MSQIEAQREMSAQVFDAEPPLQARADRAILIGSILAGTYVLVPVGCAYFLRAYRLLRRAEAEGTMTRPWSLTIAGAFALFEGIAIIFFWSTMFFSHDSVLFSTLWAGYGKFADGSYYVDWNAISIGGSAQFAEWGIALAWSFFVCAPRVAASWYLLKMKRVGLQWMIVTSYSTVCMFTVFAVTNLLPWNARIGASEFGLWAWYLANFTFISGFILLPFLHQLNRERFSD